MQMLYSPQITGVLDYVYSTKFDKLGSQNAKQLAMYSSISTLITSVINDNVLLKLNTQNNFYFQNSRITAVQMGPLLNGLLYLYFVRQFKNNIAYYNASDIKTFIKAASIYFASDNLADM